MNLVCINMHVIFFLPSQPLVIPTKGMLSSLPQFPPGCAGPTLTASPPPPPPVSQEVQSGPRGGVCPASFGRAVHRWNAGGARGWEGLGGGAGPAEPEGQRRCPSAPVLGNEHLAARCDPGHGPRTMRARRGVSLPLVSGMVAATDAPAQASTPRARWRPMLQAERAVSATARTRRAAALRASRERDALGRCPQEPRGIQQEGQPSLKGAGVVVHKKTVTQRRPHAGRRPQAPDP